MRPLALCLALVLGGCTPTLDTGARPSRTSSGGVDASAACDPGDGGCPTQPFGTTTTLGTGGTPLDTGDGSAGVKLEGGRVVIDPGAKLATLPPLIWVANSDEGTISKIDTRKLVELARYRTGPADNGGGPDPSRTTVGLTGDVIVANRAGSSVSRIAADASRCVDRNGNSQIDTSTGAADVRPWGEDECVVWNVKFQPGALARAAAFEAPIGPDGVMGGEKVWIGLWTDQKMLQLDAATGDVLDTLDVAPVHPYGAAIDHDDNVWVWGNGVVKIDPSHTVTHIPDPSPCAYGVGVDEKGRVWTAGNDCVARYTPETNRWETAKVGVYDRGVALDGHGSVWIADTDFGVHQVDEETLAVKKDLRLPFTTVIGMAIDVDHQVWAIAHGTGAAVKIDPASYQYRYVYVGQGPYTYSDMTGFQLRNAAPPSGHWHHVFDGCMPMTHFLQLAFRAETPPSTSVRLSVRVAADRAALDGKPWKTVAALPPDKGPVDLATTLGDASVGGALEVDALLYTFDPGRTPSLSQLSVIMDCVPIPQ